MPLRGDAGGGPDSHRRSVGRPTRGAAERRRERTGSRVPHATAAGRVAATDGSRGVRQSRGQKFLRDRGQSEKSSVPGAVLLPLRPQRGPREFAGLLHEQAWVGLQHLHGRGAVLLRTDQKGQNAGADPRRNPEGRVETNRRSEVPNISGETIDEHGASFLKVKTRSTQRSTRPIPPKPKAVQS